jgi:hypothetical protein
VHQHRDPNYFHTDGESHCKKEQNHNQPEGKPNPDNTQPDTYQCTLSTTDRLVVPSNFSAISSTKKLETLVNFIKIKHPATGEREDKERGPKSEPKTKKPKGGLKRGQRTKLCSNTLATSPKKAYHTKKGKGT